MVAGGSGPVLLLSGEGLDRTADFSFLSLSSLGLLGCFVEGSGLGCPMLVVPGSLGGTSPSPRCPKAGEGLRPVKAVVWVLAAALRDRLREVSEEEAESAEVERWARRLLGAGVVLRDRFRFLSLDLRLLFGVGDLCFLFLDSDSDLCFFFLELFFLSRRGELLSDLRPLSFFFFFFFCFGVGERELLDSRTRL